ncbi:MAG TPA: hypothetical protein VEV38_04245 [Candidatus Eremiobacteraceae bacterium]|nr:hypothetical protein [Candidatus Eremiobacteraceae bacterium]
MSERTSKLVWNRARALCSKCRRDVVANIGGDPKLTGFLAHVTARSPGGPRYDAMLTAEERDGYANLILLCGTCHADVDAAPEHFTVAKLHSIRNDHEQWCADKLTVDDERRAIKGEILADAVDLVVDRLSLDRWDEWTAQVLGPNPYRWPSWSLKEFRIEARPAVHGILWPHDARSLEISSKMLLDAVVEFHSTYCQYSGYDPRPGSKTVDFEYLVCPSQTQLLSGSNADGYHEFRRILEDWDATLELGLVHMTKCANWFADAVREHVNPRFRIKDGAFRMEPSKFDAGHGPCVFTEGEKRRLLAKGHTIRRSPGVWGIVADSWENAPKRGDVHHDGVA